MNHNLYIDVGPLNELFSNDGGLYRGSKILLYGIAGGGKTTTCFNIALNEIDKGNHVFYIDADYNGLHPLKLQELYSEKYNLDFPSDKFKSPKQHKETILKLWAAKGLHIHQVDSMVRIDLASSEIKKLKKTPSVIIIDSVTQYFRVDVLKQSFSPAQLMMKILDKYAKLSEESDITLVMTAQRVSEVKSHLMNKDPNSTEFREFVGGELLHHVVDNIVEFRIKDHEKGTRIATTKVKHRNGVVKETVTFGINDEGVLV